jgi:hypothetical protein
MEGSPSRSSSAQREAAQLARGGFTRAQFPGASSRPSTARFLCFSAAMIVLFSIPRLRHLEAPLVRFVSITGL